MTQETQEPVSIPHHKKVVHHIKRHLINYHKMIIAVVAAFFAFVALFVSVFGMRDTLSLFSRAASESTHTFAASATINVDGGSVTTGNEVWVGTGGDAANSYFLATFQNMALPSGSTILDADLFATSNRAQWLTMGVSAVVVGQDTPFDSSISPSALMGSESGVNFTTNVNSGLDETYSVAKLTQYKDALKKPYIAVILKGTGGSWGRKFIYGTSNAQYAPKLVVKVSEAESNTPTPQPTAIVLPTATTIPIIPTQTPALNQDVFTGVLNGAAMVPKTNTKASGSATLTLVPGTQNVLVDLIVQGFTTVQRKAFIHGPGLEGQTAAPIYTLPNGNLTAFQISLTPTQLQWLKEGKLYITVSTKKFPNGEIRGQLKQKGSGTVVTATPTSASLPSSTPFRTATPTTAINATPTPMAHGSVPGESMAMHGWSQGGKNPPNPKYDKCDDGTDVVAAHNMYHVVSYDGLKYPTWHPPVVTNPITGIGKCYFGHEHGSDPQKYLYWNEIVQHFGKDLNGDGVITPLFINAQTGQITPGDRAGIPFGMANEKMDQYYNQEGRDSIFVRHEDHVGHKIEFVNYEVDLNKTIDGNETASTNEQAQLPGTQGLNVPYYTTGTSGYKPTGVVCTHLHKFHQGTHSGDAVLNNLHEVVFHSKCQSVNVNNINAPAYYPNNTVLLTGMMAFGRPGEYKRFCFADRTTAVCPQGRDSSGKCIVNDPLLSKLPDAINSNSLGRNMVDRYCLENWTQLNPGNNYFGPYEIWEGDLMIQKANGDMLAEHGRQWDVLDPIRFVDPKSSTGFSYNSLQCARGGAFDLIQYVGGCNSRTSNTAWDSPQSGFLGLKRTTYFGRNRVSNPGGPELVWTDPLGGNAVATQFSSGLKQRISAVEADIQQVQSRIQQLYGSNNFLNDKALQRDFNSGGNTVHAPN